MDDQAIQIITIEKSASKKSKYIFNSKQFNDIIESVKDREIALISIAGPSRMGKSFLLNYFIKFLQNLSCDTEENDFSDDELTGFDWKRGIEPTTQGLWMWSKPFLIQDSDKKKIAVLLMDTQGVYDEFTDLRDWSTIFGISLLISSIFIYNEFNQLNENMFINFESYLNYGLLAAKSDEHDNPPFQQLLFLIRDWQNAADFEYGTKGGDKFFKTKLKIRDNQSDSAQRSRKLIKKCFEKVSCFLMPEPGVKARENKFFNGSVDHLNENFVEKMQELFSKLLNPETISAKTICGKSITGRDIQEYVNAYVEKFNSDELPKPTDLVEATAKACDLINVFNLKDQYVSDMKKELESKQFLTVIELNELNKKICDMIVKTFEKTKKTGNQEIIKELLELINKELSSGFTQISSENDKKRDEILNTLIENCKEFYANNMNESLKSRFVTQEIFEEISVNAKCLTQKMFYDCCGKEMDSTLESYYNKMSVYIEAQQIEFKSENNRTVNDAVNANTEAVNIAFDYYSTQINSLIKENYFFEENLFAKSEQKISANTINLFSEKCKFGDENFIQRFRDQLNIKLKEAYQQFVILNDANIEKLASKTEICLTDSIKYYTENIGNIELFSSKNELEVKHKELSEKANSIIDQFNVLNYSEFIIPYKTRLNDELEKINSEMLNLFENSMSYFTSFCEHKVEETFNIYSKEMKNLFDENDLSENDKLDKIKSNTLNEVIMKFGHVSKINIYAEIENFIIEKMTNEIDLLLMNKLVNQYITDMNAQLENELYLSRRELNNIHIENKLKVADSFNDNIKSKDTTFIQSIKKSLKSNLESMYQKIFNENEKRRDNVINDAIAKCKDDYCNDMLLKLNDAHNYLSFDELSEQAKQNLLKYFNEICGKERDMYDQYYNNFYKLINSEESNLRIMHKECVLESKTTNLSAVYKASMFYNEKMTTLSHKRICASLELFEQNENTIREETLRLFKDFCDKYGNQEFIETLLKNLNDSKDKFSSQFQTELNQLTANTEKAFNQALNYYVENINKIIDSMPSSEEFIEKHEMFKIKSIDIFKENCTINNEDYVESNISKLSLDISELFDKNQKNLTESIDNMCSKVVNEFYENYSQQMRDLLDETNSRLLDSDELIECHERTNSKLIIAMRGKLEKYVDRERIEKYESNLLWQTFEEFKRISKNNGELIEIKNRSLQIEIREHLSEYKHNMESVAQNCITDEDFLNYHVYYQKYFLDKFSHCNPFRNTNKFETHLTCLESEIDNAFEHFRPPTTDNNKVLFTQVMTEAKEFYRSEMQKFFQEFPTKLTTTNFENKNISIVNLAVETFQPKVNHISVDEFKVLLTSNWKITYDSFASKLNAKETFIGIDLGTKYVCATHYKSGSIDLIPNKFDSTSYKTPCVLYYDNTGFEVIGNVSEKIANSSKFNQIYSTKRLIGREFSDIAVQSIINSLPFNVIDSNNTNLMIQLNKDKQLLYPEQVTAKILKHIKNQAEIHLNTAINGAVISVPAYFTDSQKVATKHAAMLAGFDCVKLISCPIAVAIAYKLNYEIEDSRNLLIYDFGAGFLDVAIIALDRDCIEVKAIGGDCNIGGDNIDHNLVQYCLKKFLKIYPRMRFMNESIEGVQAIKRLTEMCEKSKFFLLKNNYIEIIINNFYGGLELKVKLTKEKFDSLNQDLFDKSLEAVKQTLTDAKMTANDINDVILVGGSTKIPKVHQMLMQLFGNRPLNNKLSEYAVALGAAYMSAQLNGTLSGIKHSNIAPFSLGVAHNYGISYAIVRRHTKLPHKKTIPVTTSEDNQTNLSIKVYEGEDIRVFNNKVLGIFNINGIPAAAAGKQQIDIIFEVTEEGILHAKAKLSSNAKDLGVIENKCRLTSDEIKYLSQQI